jgi:hypothetical protein
LRRRCLPALRLFRRFRLALFHGGGLRRLALGLPRWPPELSAFRAWLALFHGAAGRRRGAVPPRTLCLFGPWLALVHGAASRARAGGASRTSGFRLPLFQGRLPACAGGASGTSGHGWRCSTGRTACAGDARDLQAFSLLDGAARRIPAARRRRRHTSARQRHDVNRWPLPPPPAVISWGAVLATLMRAFRSGAPRPESATEPDVPESPSNGIARDHLVAEDCRVLRDRKPDESTSVSTKRFVGTNVLARSDDGSAGVASSRRRSSAAAAPSRRTGRCSSTSPTREPRRFRAPRTSRTRGGLSRIRSGTGCLPRDHGTPRSTRNRFRSTGRWSTAASGWKRGGAPSTARSGS